MKDEKHEHQDGKYLFGADWRTQERYTRDCDVCRESLNTARREARQKAAELNMQDFIARADAFANPKDDIREYIEARRSLTRSLMYALALLSERDNTYYHCTSDFMGVPCATMRDKSGTTTA